MAFWSGLLARPAPIPLYARPSLTLFFCISGAFILTLVPHAAQYFPVWLSGVLVTAIAVRCVMEAYRLPLPTINLSSFLAIIFFALILIQYGTVMGRDAGTALTAGLLAIKFYEIRRPRDIALIIFACFFMVMSSLLYSQVLELFIYCLIMMWILTALLLRLHTGDTRQDRLLPILKSSGIIFLQALPLMVFLFVFFPRYPGNLSFSMGDSKIGLTDSVAPGSIAKLAQDDREAMYVKFNTRNAPLPESMYFRALALWDYGGGRWTAGSIANRFSSKETPAPSPSDISQSYVVLAHNQKWLFALDVPISKPVNPEEAQWAELYNGDIVQLSGATLLNHTERYTVISSAYRAEEKMNPAEFNASTQLPNSPTDQIDPGVIELARQLSPADAPEMDYVYAVLKYFHQSGFRYTTDPGPQGPDWLPDFVLKRKTGFCEHFASAFAVMMRLRHIPSRVIVGYLGADYNSYSDKWVVSQSNAHAWDEIFVASGGDAQNGFRGKWIRIDPTSAIPAVDGSQLSHTEEANDALMQQVKHHTPTFSDKYLPIWARNAIREMQLRRQQVESGWDDLVFSYDPQVQTRLASALGFHGETVFSLLTICALVFGTGYFGFQKWMRRKKHQTPIESLYGKFCRKMAQRGIPRASWEGPLAYTERVAEAFPDDKATLEWVGSIVARARYGPGPADAAMPEKLKALLMVLSASQAATAANDRR